MTKATNFIILSLTIISLLSLTVNAQIMNITDQIYLPFDNYDASSNEGRGYTFQYLGSSNTYLTGIMYGAEPSNQPTRFRFYSGTPTLGTLCPAGYDYQQTLPQLVGIIVMDSNTLTTPQLLQPGYNYTVCLDDNGAAWQPVIETTASLSNFQNYSLGSTGLINYTSSFMGTTVDKNIRAFTGLVIQKDINLTNKTNPTINLTGKNVIFYDDYNRANTYIGSLGNSLNPVSGYVSWYDGGVFTVGIENNAFRQTKSGNQYGYSARVKTNLNTSINEFNSSLDIKLHVKLTTSFTDTKNYTSIIDFTNTSSSTDVNPLGIQGSIQFNGISGRALSIPFWPNSTIWNTKAYLITYYEPTTYTIDVTYAPGLAYIKSVIINGKEYVNPELDRIFGLGLSTSYTNPFNLSLEALEFWVSPADTSYTTLYDEVAVYQEPISTPSTSINVTTNLTPSLLYINTTLQGYCNINVGDNTNLTLGYQLRKNNISILSNTSNATSGVNYNLFNYSLSTNDYGSNFSLYCNATNIYNTTGFFSNEADKQVHDLITYNMSQFKNNTNLPYFPQVGDTVQLNGSVTSRDTINICFLQTNVTGSWVNGNNISLNQSGVNLNVPLTYTVTNNSARNNSVVYWRLLCNDTFGTNTQSNASEFNVSDITFPAIVIGPNGLNINTNNRTVFSRDLYNLTYNITYFDYNLFAVEINVTCELDGQAYYWSNTSILLQNYTVTGRVPLNTLSFQKCNFFTAASDSHTKKEIPDYGFTTLNNGLSFLTEYGTHIQVLSSENAGQIKKLAATKETDRYTFDFEFNGNKKNRQFTLLSDKKIYYINNSKYSGHFIIWDESKFNGNWIDFEVDDKTNLDYVITKINDYQYQISISHKHNGNLNAFKFKSIGGTTISNYNLDFYVGGNIYVDSNNSYDGNRINGFNYQLITTDGINNYTGWINGNGTIQNVSNGTYNITFTNSTFFLETESTALTNSSVNVTVNGFQNQYNFIFRNVKTLATLYNVSYTLRNLATGWNVSGNTGNTSPLVKYLNNGTYNITWSAAGYDNMTSSFSAATLENRTLTLDTNFLASFTLFDEKLSTLRGTNVEFNVSAATSISFLLFCPGETRAQIVNSSNFTVPISCNYNLFEFLLTYGTSSYYRAFIIAPDDAFNVKIYLIDLSTTPYLFNSLVADDLLSQYVNPRIFVKKVIGNNTVQITANYVDIEQKIGAYLIENNQYIVEIYSDNLPVYAIGNYFADAAGTKNIRLYQVGIYSDTAGTSAPSLGQITVINATESNSTLFYRYQDDTNLTTSVSFNVYQNNNPVPICTDSLTNNNNLLVACPITGYNSSKIVTEQTITRAGQTSTIKQIIRDITEIQLGITQYFGQAQINWFLIIVIASLALFGTIQTANLFTFALVGLAVLFNIFGWLVMSTSVLAFAVMVALISIFKEGDKIN